MIAIQRLFTDVLEMIFGWPFIIYVLVIGIICTVVCSFVQFRYFLTAWKVTFCPERAVTSKPEQADMSPFQAFLGVLNASIGNGTVAGIATAVASGGPGATFWIFAMSFVLMALRFSEVYLSAYFSAKAPVGTVIGGPMLYLKTVNKSLPYCYAATCLFFGLLVGNTMQSNSINLSFSKTTGLDISLPIAIIIFLFVVYIVCGGAARVAKASEALVPLKVGLFFSATIVILLYHYKSLIPALILITKSAFQPIALAGGLLGFGIQQAMRFGLSRSIVATESGLGTAAILFGSTGSVEPVKDGLMGMLSAFISSMVCTITGLCIVVSGAWESGLTSTALTSKAFETVFGTLGNWIVMILSISFGIGVLVTYAYITRESWLYLTGKRYGTFFSLLYCLFAFAGPLISVGNVWFLVETSNAFLIFINLFGILWLLPIIKKGIAVFNEKQKKEYHEE